MSERVVLVGEAAMSAALAKVLERDQITSDRRIEFRAVEQRATDNLGMLLSNRAMRRRNSNQDKKRMKGLRP